MSEAEAEKRPRDEEPAALPAVAVLEDPPAPKKVRVELEPGHYSASDVAPAAAPLGAPDNDALAKLLSFYFSDANLRRDKFLIAEQAKTTEGWVPIRVLLTFNRIKQVSTFLRPVAEIGHFATTDCLLALFNFCLPSLLC
jgi:hypothetical protein